MTFFTAKITKEIVIKDIPKKRYNINERTIRSTVEREVVPAKCLQNIYNYLYQKVWSFYQGI